MAAPKAKAQRDVVQDDADERPGEQHRRKKEMSGGRRVRRDGAMRWSRSARVSLLQRRGSGGPQSVRSPSRRASSLVPWRQDPGSGRRRTPGPDSRSAELRSSRTLGGAIVAPKRSAAATTNTAPASSAAAIDSHGGASDARPRPRMTPATRATARRQERRRPAGSDRRPHGRHDETLASQTTTSRRPPRVTSSCARQTIRAPKEGPSPKTSATTTISSHTPLLVVVSTELARDVWQPSHVRLAEASGSECAVKVEGTAPSESIAHTPICWARSRTNVSKEEALVQERLVGPGDY